MNFRKVCLISFMYSLEGLKSFLLQLFTRKSVSSEKIEHHGLCNNRFNYCGKILVYQSFPIFCRDSLTI